MKNPEKDILILIGKKIRNERKKQKISQAQLAFESEIPREQIVRIEKAQGNPTIKTLLKITNALNIQLKELIS